MPAVAPRTVVEAFLPERGAAPLHLLYGLANAAGIEDQPLRLAIRRMIAAGEITQDGRGRHGAVTLTPLGRDRLGRDRLGLRLALAQDLGHEPWDGRWHLLAVSAPESERAVRDSLRRLLVEAGAAPVSTGLYVSPHDLTPMLGGAGAGALVRAVATDLEVRGVTDPRAIAERLWPAAPVVDGYAPLARACAEAASFDGTATEQVLVHQLRLADALERAVRHDPLVPPDLRTGTWPPSAIRLAWYRAWNDLSARLPREHLYRGWLTTPAPRPARESTSR